MTVWPLKFRECGDGRFLLTDDAGGFFLSRQPFLERYAAGELSPVDQEFLRENGHAFDREGDPDWTAFAYRWAQRQAIQQELSYVILVPTLRCNLTCGYCQVSRAPETARGFDWSEETLNAALDFIGAMKGPQIKVEFQGGEPLLRIDLLEQVRSFVRTRFPGSQFVVCTNLQRLGDREWAFLDQGDTFVSTSLDGDRDTHQRQRTHDDLATDTFFKNLAEAVQHLGPGKVSALPTIDVDEPPDFEELVGNFEGCGVHSIYLRPINHQGFARRRGSDPNSIAKWNTLHSGFIDYLIERNHRTGRFVEEYYFSQCLRRFLRSGADDHVDLRNPNFSASDYIVIDHDGQFYPTDEARMLSRIGRVDLSIGSVAAGIDQAKVQLLNHASFNNFDPDCIHCVYQPFCGTDVVDDLSRNGRIDLARTDTWFCQRHMSLFDKIVEVIRRRDEPALKSVAKWARVPSWGDHMIPVHA
ncbi:MULTISPECIES: His-Xaa-Ser system radical SAM maturase HxsB [unclassified Mesorhizobium]|uniref:His-Xaa-Ser system radical SAM maturase HxsB n=1 Tax=unclassified Mesorhizobium TaxID=325217 RepID=UPI0010926222|nr:MULTISPECIES: His-Xaa-Ser system radical SAM maturase HxsB [unclassified Mesorhizobium]TGQ27670.1 His-Xaa-Ser system radical SAM maturase HxsB [Mesorhizobium sp. M4B.F.Ca.ET.214.01.1.1]TGQ54889.1 His-Xaa-Ser system radical SAM maturase HxsB [Mesorhizobium sp. M4B.F.Ca.ET.211.01.1.1]TGU28289.1 His-Xaa-Ser system radical SAM maturase HxsB [Mesorhizobium sp. M4B.F.Ca.ET.150.01.1.1]